MQLDIVSNLNIKNNQKISILPKQNNNINFKGLFSDISDSYIRRSQEKIHENAAFKEAIDSSISARRMMNYTLNNFEKKSNGYLDEYNSFKMLAQHSNPYFGMDIDKDILSINKLTQKPESYIIYQDDTISLPLTGTQKNIKSPAKIVIGEDYKQKNTTEKIFYLNEDVSMQNVNRISDYSMKAKRIELFDVRSCKMPAFQFLKAMHCNGAVFDNFSIDAEGTINAKSLITYSRTKDGKLYIDDIFLYPVIKQPHIDVDDEYTAPNRTTITSMYKFSTIGGLRYRNLEDYQYKTIIQKNPSEMYYPKREIWRGNCDFCMEPVIGNSGRYKCKMQCKTFDSEVESSSKTKTLIF